MIEPLVYLNGRTVPASQAHVAIFDAGIVLGATVTEMTRTFHQRPGVSITTWTASTARSNTRAWTCVRRGPS